jgi:NAD(P)H-dependent flavin oxidoreductase YrpB (nitropropane dioxygenase family)
MGVKPNADAFRRMLGIDLPIIQAPMAGVQGNALAAAVSNAGGLGSLPCAILDADAMRSELTALASATAAPFNVNFFCHTTPRVDAQHEARWRAALAPYYQELGIEPAPAPAEDARIAFGPNAADVLAEFKPRIVSFHFGLPSAELVSRVKGWGTKVLSSATTVEEALWLEAHGVDAIVAQGVEAGGHRGMFLSDDVSTQIGTLALVPQIVRAVRVPVVAAGGIADARGVSAALELGAAGVQIGPAYGADQRLHGSPRARHRESARARGRSDQPGGAGVSARGFGSHAVARQGGIPREQRLLVVLGGSEHQRLQGSARCRPDRAAGGGHHMICAFSHRLAVGEVS